MILPQKKWHASKTLQNHYLASLYHYIIIRLIAWCEEMGTHVHVPSMLYLKYLPLRDFRRFTFFWSMNRYFYEITETNHFMSVGHKYCCIDWYHDTAIWPINEVGVTRFMLFCNSYLEHLLLLRSHLTGTELRWGIKRHLIRAIWRNVGASSFWGVSKGESKVRSGDSWGSYETSEHRSNE